MVVLLTGSAGEVQDEAEVEWVQYVPWLVAVNVLELVDAVRPAD